MSKIPCIIHQTGPTSKALWHPLWFECQKSWLNNFANYEYRLWNDEQLEELIIQYYPEYWDMFQELPVHIMKIDFARFCILDKFGGIYADLDFFCFKNFSHFLKKDTYVVENPFGNYPIENSLMCSASNSTFFKKCLEKAKNRFYEIKNKYPHYLDQTKFIAQHGKVLRPYMVFYITGLDLISSVYRENKDIAEALPGFLFNNLDYSYDHNFYTKHLHTGVWGKEDLKYAAKFANGMFCTLSNNIPVDQYNVYYDYSNGQYKKKYEMDFDKNDSEGQLLSSTRFFYNYG